MARVLNNEVSILNIASLDNDIKDSFTRAMITENVNTTSVASKAYSEGEYFIHNDRYLYKALTDITIGETITPDVNAEVVTISEELVNLFAQSPEGIFEILSNVESTERASRNYLAGEQIIWTDKLLYTVTTDVVSGGLWEVGTNLSSASNLTSQIQTLTNDLAIVENGNTCTHTGGISTGQYVIWKGTLCTAVSNISVGETLTNSGGSKNLKDVNDGGFNDLYSNSLRCVDVPVTITCAAQSFARQNIAIQTGEKTVASRISASIIDVVDISAGICGYGRVIFFCENAQNATAATLRIWYTVKRF